MKLEYGIADAHAHIYPSNIAGRASETIGKFYDLPMRGVGTDEHLLCDGTAAGITRYLVCSVALKSEHVISINDFLYQTCQTHPEFVGFATIHQHMKDWEAEISRVADRGFYGVKVHADFQKFNIDDPGMIELLPSCGPPWKWCFSATWGITEATVLHPLG